MRDNEHRTSVHEAVHAGLHDGLRAGINRAGRLIEDHNRRIGNRRTRDGKQLALTLRQTAAVAVDDGIVAVRQSADEVVRIGKLRRSHDFLVGRIQTTVADIIADGAGKQVGILQNDTERAAEVRLFDLIDIDAVVADLAVREVVETVDQVGDGRLARARCADERDLLTGLSIQRDVVQNDLIRVITEIHIEEADIAADLRVGGGAVLVRVLPRPDVGLFRGFSEFAVLIVLGVNESNVAVVYLRLLVHQLKDTLGTGKRHNDGVELLRDLRYRLGERLGQLQEGRDNADGDAVSDHAGQRQRAADDRDQNVQQVADVHHDRHEDVCEGIRARSILAQLIVERIELLLALFLVAEHLDDLLAVDHLLDIAVDPAERLLLLEEVLRGLTAQLLYHLEHDAHAKQYEQRQPYIRHQHADEHRDNGHRRGKHLRHGLAEHLLQRIGIVGEMAHQIAVGMRIEVANRQLLHVREHLVTHLFEHAL